MEEENEKENIENIKNREFQFLSNFFISIWIVYFLYFLVFNNSLKAFMAALVPLFLGLTYIIFTRIYVSKVYEKKRQIRKRLVDLEKIWENIEDVVYTVKFFKKELIVTTVTPSVEKILGFPMEAILGKSIRELEFIRPGAKNFSPAYYRESMEKGEARVVEAVFYSKEGKQLIGEVKSTPFFNETGEMVGFISSVRNMTEKKKKEREREELIEKLEKALREVAELKEIIPICCNCKKIRNDKGYWEQLEAYLTKNNGLLFSHGICEECAKKLYPELYKPQK